LAARVTVTALTFQSLDGVHHSLASWQSTPHLWEVTRLLVVSRRVRGMPTVSLADQVRLHVSTLHKQALATYQASSTRHPFPVAGLIQQVVSDRLSLAGEHLRSGDELLLRQHFRFAIGRHYYAMYHAARAVVFAVEKGDDYERHNLLPRHLPPQMIDVGSREVELTNARLLRNQADYDCYPVGHTAWETDARSLSSTAATFVNAFESFALLNGYV
jgi:uncharacterized protein (UPF0332 family)